MFAKFSQSILIFVNFPVGMIVNETKHLLKCLKLYEKNININET